MLLAYQPQKFHKGMLYKRVTQGCRYEKQLLENKHITAEITKRAPPITQKYE